MIASLMIRKSSVAAPDDLSPIKGGKAMVIGEQWGEGSARGRIVAAEEHSGKSFRSGKSSRTSPSHLVSSPAGVV